MLRRVSRLFRAAYSFHYHCLDDETSVSLFGTTTQNISHLHNRRLENLKSHYDRLIMIKVMTGRGEGNKQFLLQTENWYTTFKKSQP
jgi:hypothetical protein